MNQILATNPEKPNNKPKKEKTQRSIRTSAQTDIIKVTKVFAIILLLFGIFMVGTGSYAMYHSGTGNGNSEVELVKPVISIEEIEGDETTLLLKVTSKTGIDKVIYKWNDEKETTLSGKGGAYLEQKVQIPAGSNILNITATDINQEESTYSKKYELNSNIKIEATDTGKVRITYEGDTEISYMTYRWDDNQEETIDINSYGIDEEIEALSGRHTLTVVVVDINNRTETKVQETNGVSIPELKIDFDEEHTKYIIKATDSIELKEIIITLDEDETQRYGQKISGKEFQFEIPLKESSDNKMKVEVTNSDNQKTERKVMFPK